MFRCRSSTIMLGGAHLLCGGQVVRTRGVGTLQALFNPDVARRSYGALDVSAISWPVGSPMARTSASFCLAYSLRATISCCCRFGIPPGPEGCRSLD